MKILIVLSIVAGIASAQTVIPMTQRIGSTRVTKPMYNSADNAPLACIITTADGYVAAAVAP